MKIIEQRIDEGSRYDDYLYYFDDLKGVDNLRLLFMFVAKNNYSISEYIINYDSDHSNSRAGFRCNTSNELFEQLLKDGILDVRTIDFLANYNGLNLIGTVAPGSGMLRFSFPKKKDNDHVVKK